MKAITTTKMMKAHTTIVGSPIPRNITWEVYLEDYTGAGLKFNVNVMPHKDQITFTSVKLNKDGSKKYINLLVEEHLGIEDFSLARLSGLVWLRARDAIQAGKIKFSDIKGAK